MEGGGVEKGQFKSITDKLLCMLISQTNIVFYILSSLSISMKELINNEIIDSMLEDAMNKINKVKMQAIEKIDGITKKKYFFII